MKCNTCTTTNERHPVMRDLKDSKYPIHNVCISEYFEKTGQKGMDLVCDTFNSVHFGYILNLLHHGTNPEGSTSPTEAPPIVVWANSKHEGSMFILEDATRDTVYESLYKSLENVPSEAYSMIVNSTMKMVATNEMMDDMAKDTENYDKLTKLERLKLFTDTYDEGDFHKSTSLQDAVVIQGQSLENDFSYKAIATFGEHNGIKYLKPFKLIDATDDIITEVDELRKKAKKSVKDTFTSEFFKDIGDKFKDKEEDTEESTDFDEDGIWHS